MSSGMFWNEAHNWTDKGQSFWRNVAFILIVCLWKWAAPLLKVPAGLRNQNQLNLCTAVETYATLKTKAVRERGVALCVCVFFPRAENGTIILRTQGKTSPELKLHLALAAADGLDPRAQFSSGNTMLHTLRRKWKLEPNDLFSIIMLKALLNQVWNHSVSIFCSFFSLHAATVDAIFLNKMKKTP